MTKKTNNSKKKRGMTTKEIQQIPLLELAQMPTFCDKLRNTRNRVGRAEMHLQKLTVGAIWRVNGIMFCDLKNKKVHTFVFSFINFA